MLNHLHAKFNCNVYIYLFIYLFWFQLNFKKFNQKNYFCNKAASINTKSGFQKQYLCTKNTLYTCKEALNFVAVLKLQGEKH